MSNKVLKDKLIALVVQELIAGNWNNLTIDYFSKELKVSFEKILLICSSKHELLDMWSRNIDDNMVKNISIKELETVPVKERLLELMLCRFDILATKREEVYALVKLSKLNIIEAKNSLNRINRSMELICNYSGIIIDGSVGKLKIKTLSFIWLIVFKEWFKSGIHDENMLVSRIDKNLTVLEKFKNIIIK